jgi:hypothetical protein
MRRGIGLIFSYFNIIWNLGTDAKPAPVRVPVYFKNPYKQLKFENSQSFIDPQYCRNRRDG